jgi:hypothetical protein
MLHLTRTASLAFAVSAVGVSSAVGQTSLVDLLRQHDVVVDNRGIEGAFDDGAEPSPVTNRTGKLTGGLAPGALAAPLAILRSGSLRERREAAYAFGILAGRWSGFPTYIPASELAAGISGLLELIASPDRRARVAGSRVIGRVLAVHFDLVPEPYPNGVLDALFGLLNQSNDIEQLAAMDALGLIRASTAVNSLTERYWFYRKAEKRGLAGGALEALTRIGDPSTKAIVEQLVTDRWAEGNDPTALAALFARARFLNDGSMLAIRQTLDRKSRRIQAAQYLGELTPSVR